MFRTFLISAALAISAPAFAQDHTDHGSAYKGEHAGHDHKVDDHAGHDMSMTEGALKLADQPDLTVAVAAGGEPIVAKVLGAVCDFCAKAMNKTFGKRDDVAAVYVDLDAKTLNLVMKSGATLSDKDLRKLVKKSGYKVDSIMRGKAVLAK